MPSAGNLKEKLTKKAKEKTIINSKTVLSSGTTLLNLACTGRIDGAFVKGKYYQFVGDSNSGKTFLCLTCFAEANLNENFKHYRLIYDNGEDGALMDIEKFFGKGVAARLEPPNGTRENPVHSTTIEEFYYNLWDACSMGTPFVYVMDSYDVLSSKAEGKKFNENCNAFRKGREGKGSFGDGKAKISSSNLRLILSKIREMDSIVILINQSRANIDPMAMEDKTYSGGWAVKFYATIQLWSSVAKKITKRVGDRDRQQGIVARVQTKKNRVTGKDRSVRVPIYWSHGIDDVGGNVDYLELEGHWKKGKGGLLAKEFNFTGNREEIVAHVETNGLEKELQLIVKEKWDSIEAACVIQRKSRYG